MLTLGHSSPNLTRRRKSISPPIAMTPYSVDEIDAVIDPLSLGLPPLPDEKYPRIVERLKPDGGYYVALALVMGVWVITPLSCAYLIWFVLFGQGLKGASGLTATIFAAYATTEVVFSIYMSYLIKYVQTPAPPSTLPLEKRNELFRRVLRSNLSFPKPTRPRPKEGDLDREEEREVYKLYETGQVTAAEYHHIVDRHYEEMHGMQVRKRVGKMTEAEKDLITDFLEEEPGEREKRLRDQIEKDVGYGQDDFDSDGLVDGEGNLIKLHPMDRRAVEFRERLRTWFNHAPWDKLKRDNVLIWLSWSCFNVPYEEVKANEEWNKFLLTSLAMLEARTGTDFPEGFDPNIEIMRLTLDPVNAKGRPLILYALTNIVNWWLRAVVYPNRGMGYYKEDGIEYLIRIPKGWTAEKAKSSSDAMPIVYLHGLGFGLLQSHLLTMKLLTALPTHPILIPIAHHTTQSIFHERHLQPWSKKEVVSTMKKICVKWGFFEETRRGGRGGVSLLSHSNGSVVHGWILKDCPDLVKRNTFVDPVIFCLWEGDICHSFCYRKPAKALELLLYYFIASEVGIANYIQRHFDWADNNLFFDEIPYATDPSRTAFFFGGQDIIIDAARARKYLEQHGVKQGIHWEENAGHGDGLSGESLRQVINYVGTGSTRP